MKTTYLKAAESEFDEAIYYYNERQPGLGFDFADQVKEALGRIRNFPESGHRCLDESAVARFIGFLTASSTKREMIS